MPLRSHQSGFHLVPVLSIAGVVVLIGALGFLFWNNFGKSTAEVAMDAASKQAREECEKEADKDICKFLSNWKLTDNYKMTSTMSDGSVSTYAIDGKNTHMKSEGEYAYEVITIDKTTYTKAGDTWYKSLPAEQQGTGDVDNGIEPPTLPDPSEEETKNTITYRLISKEACGDKKCFKYQIVDTENKDSIDYVWFDDQDYLIRKSYSEFEGEKFETTYEYANVSVKVPSPVKDLKEGEIIMPGGTGPVNMLEMTSPSEL